MAGSDRHLLVVDVDTGVDDAHALMLALTWSQAEVLAVTCVNGNVGLQAVCDNTLRVLQVCRKSEIPVYPGCDRPLLGTAKQATHYHGQDGLGGVEWPDQMDRSLLQKEHAANALVRLANERPGEITLVALAPLTNLALAMRLDPDFSKKLKALHIMGGNIEGRGRVSTSAEFNFFTDPEAAHAVLSEGVHVTLLPYEVCLRHYLTWVYPLFIGRGNIGPGAEFNFGVDPEAASVVLAETQCPTSILPWEPCMKLVLDWEFYEKWTSQDTDKARFKQKITKHSMEIQKKKNYAGFRSCDLMAMAALLVPECVVETKAVYALVELHSHLTRGQMVVDWADHLGRPANVTLITQLDVPVLEQHLLAMVH